MELGQPPEAIRMPSLELAFDCTQPAWASLRTTSGLAKLCVVVFCLYVLSVCLGGFRVRGVLCQQVPEIRNQESFDVHCVVWICWLLAVLLCDLQNVGET